ILKKLKGVISETPLKENLSAYVIFALSGVLSECIIKQIRWLISQSSENRAQYKDQYKMLGLLLTFIVRYILSEEKFLLLDETLKKYFNSLLSSELPLLGYVEPVRTTTQSSLVTTTTTTVSTATTVTSAVTMTDTSGATTTTTTADNLIIPEKTLE